MFNESVSLEIIKKRIERFRTLCNDLGINTSNRNPVCQRLEAAEWFCAELKPFENQDLDLLVKTGEFLGLMNCLEVLKDRINGTIHVERLVKEATYANEFVELMTADMIERAGFSAVLDEPDVVVGVGDTKIGLACKKLDSAKKLVERIREARDQIQQSGKSGIIVVDVSRIVGYASGAVAATQDDAYHALYLGTERLWSQVASQVIKKIQGSLVGSVLFCNLQFYGVRHSVDYENRIINYTPFSAAYLDLRSRRGRPISVETLENAIMRQGANHPESSFGYR